MKKIYKDLENDICKQKIEDKNISFAIILQFCLLITNYSFKQIFNITNPSSRAIVSAIFMLIVGIVFLKNLNIVLKRKGRLFVGLYSGSISIILFHTLLFNQNIEYMGEIIFYLFLICIPIFLYYYAIYDKAIFLSILMKSAYYQMGLGVIFFIDTLFSPIEYDMVFSYLILVPLTILLYKIYNKFNLFDTFLIALGLFMIIVVGARGPIISLVIFWIVLILINSFRNKIKLTRLMVFLIALIIIVLGMVYYESILLKIDLLLQDIGIYSRTITILLTENIDFSSGRIPIYKYTIERIVDKPIFGYGIAGDRIFLNGTYPHNIFLEILVHFGVISGSIIIIMLIFYWFSSMVRSKNKEEVDLAIIFFGIGLVNLLISGSYITSSNFWLFMAICIDSVHGSKIKYKT